MKGYITFSPNRQNRFTGSSTESLLFEPDQPIDRLQGVDICQLQINHRSGGWFEFHVGEGRLSDFTKE